MALTFVRIMMIAASRAVVSPTPLDVSTMPVRTSNSISKNI
jgi:hypothetical protein